MKLSREKPDNDSLRARRSRHHKLSKKPWSRKRKIATSILAVFIVILGVFGWFGSRILGSIDKEFHGNIFSDAEALFSRSNLKESNGRINILVGGDSADDPGHGGADLTDSIMVISLDPSNHTGFLFSIPRDLWVYIPGLNSYQKINAANDVTNFSQSGLPSGGMGQLQQIVQNDLGIPIDYYALVNYAAFKDAVDAVGGITVDIDSSDTNGLYDSYTHLSLPNGEDSLDGQEALDLAKARCDQGAGDICYGFPDSDFTRTMYQRKMVVSILNKATSIGVVTNPIRITALFGSLADNVQTDLSLQNVLSIDKAMSGINLSSLGSYTYSNSTSGDSNPLLVGYVNPKTGADSLAPSDGVGNYAGLKGYFQQLTSSSAVAKENASIEVLNGTNITGLATTAENKLQAKDIVNVSTAVAAGNYNQTMIVDNSGGKDPATKKLLEQMFPGSQVVTLGSGSAEAKEASEYTSDSFVIVVGQNYADSNSAGSNTGSGTSNTGSGTSSTGSYTN